MYVYMCVGTCMYVYVQVHVYMERCVFMCVCMCVCVSLCPHPHVKATEGGCADRFWGQKVLTKVDESAVLSVLKFLNHRCHLVYRMVYVHLFPI